MSNRTDADHNGNYVVTSVFTVLYKQPLKLTIEKQKTGRPENRSLYLYAVTLFGDRDFLDKSLRSLIE